MLLGLTGREISSTKGVFMMYFNDQGGTNGTLLDYANTTWPG